MSAKILNTVIFNSFSTLPTENLLNYASTFNDAFTANIASGSGTAVTDNEFVLSGSKSLKLHNNTKTTAMVVNGVSSWYSEFFNNAGTLYNFQFSLYNNTKSDAKGYISIYCDALEVYRLNFDTNGKNEQWVTFSQNIEFPSPNFDYKIYLEHDTTYFMKVYFDNFKLEGSLK